VSTRRSTERSLIPLGQQYVAIISSWIVFASCPILTVSYFAMSAKKEELHMPLALAPNGFNAQADMPHGLQIAHVKAAMERFIEFLGFINEQLVKKTMPVLEMMLMPANFSSLVGEFMVAHIGRICPSMAKNQYHNGYPDLIPINRYESDAVQHGSEGIEVKASRYMSGWQGHNPETGWLMVFMFDSSRQQDLEQGLPQKPFHFRRIAAARLREEDWSFSGRSATSRRTITASVIRSGRDKMMSNWIYNEAGPLL